MKARRVVLAMAIGGAALTAAPGYAGSPGDQVPSGPGVPWMPPPELAPSAVRRPAAEVPPELLTPGRTVSLAEAIDVALANSPATRETWLAARAAAADVESKRSTWYPQLDFEADLQRQQLSAVGGRFQFSQSTYSPSLDLSYLLFNFGGRKAEVDEARQKLLAANWSHNAALQEVVLQVAAAYYQYLNAKALYAAADSDLTSFTANLEAAEERHKAGVATIADVLQAKTQVAQARLGLERLAGRIKTIRGVLATAMGVSPNIPVEAGDLPADVPVAEVTRTVDEILERALAAHPNLAAARATAAAAERHVAKIRADYRPRLALDATANRVYYASGESTDPSDNFSAIFSLRFPIFTGFKRRSEVAKAAAEAGAAEARVESLTQQVMLEVWTSYYELETAAQRVTTSRELLASAGESADVAAGRYKAGVGSILDLLAAQSLLANARAEEVQARSDWFVGLAQLARDAGALGTLEPAAVLDLIRDQEHHEEP